MVTRESLLMAAAGLILGLPLAVVVSHLLRAQLYQLSYLDPASFFIAVVVTLGVTVGAAVVPARRAARIDPMQALRTE
jgi:ABC-type antimicrobial peptide transport system permease subunit